MSYKLCTTFRILFLTFVHTMRIITLKWMKKIKGPKHLVTVKIKNVTAISGR